MLVLHAQGGITVIKLTLQCCHISVTEKIATYEQHLDLVVYQVGHNKKDKGERCAFFMWRSCRCQSPGPPTGRVTFGVIATGTELC